MFSWLLVGCDVGPHHYYFLQGDTEFKEPNLTTLLSISTVSPEHPEYFVPGSPDENGASGFVVQFRTNDRKRIYIDSIRGTYTFGDDAIKPLKLAYQRWDGEHAAQIYDYYAYMVPGQDLLQPKSSIPRMKLGNYHIAIDYKFDGAPNHFETSISYETKSKFVFNLHSLRDVQ